jgi:hypothetical protein
MFDTKKDLEKAIGKSTNKLQHWKSTYLISFV